MNFYVGYPGHRGDNGFDDNPYGWLLRPTGQLADVPTGKVFLIGWGRAGGWSVLVAYFPIRRFEETAAGHQVIPGNSFPLPDLPLPEYLLEALPRMEENKQRSLLPLDDYVGQQLLTIVQRHLASTNSSVTLGKARAARAKKKKSPSELAEAIEREARGKGRVGQAAFRERLIETYGACPITGCALEPALSAAHIWEYHQGGGYELWNGILLRADIHLLFDRHLLRIFPGDPPVVVLGESIRAVPGYDFHMNTLDVPKGVDRARMKEVLRERWDAADEAFGPFPEP